MSPARAPGCRFPKHHRLVCSFEYRSVIAHDCKSKDALFVVYAHNNGHELGRLGITVSRRVSPKAVERNQIKRAMRESFRHQQKILAGLDIVAIARGATKGTETKKLIVSLEKHWRRVNQQCKLGSS